MSTITPTTSVVQQTGLNPSEAQQKLDLHEKIINSVKECNSRSDSPSVNEQRKSKKQNYQVVPFEEEVRKPTQSALSSINGQLDQICQEEKNYTSSVICSVAFGVFSGVTWTLTATGVYFLSSHVLIPGAVISTILTVASSISIYKAVRHKKDKTENDHPSIESICEAINQKNSSIEELEALLIRLSEKEIKELIKRLGTQYDGKEAASSFLTILAKRPPLLAQIIGEVSLTFSIDVLSKMSRDEKIIYFSEVLSFLRNPKTMSKTALENVNALVNDDAYESIRNLIENSLPENNLLKTADKISFHKLLAQANNLHKEQSITPEALATNLKNVSLEECKNALSNMSPDNQKAFFFKALTLLSNSINKNVSRKIKENLTGLTKDPTYSESVKWAEAQHSQNTHSKETVTFENLLKQTKTK